jgi:ribonuclease P protein component
VLSASNRLTSPVHFREVVRRGRRRGGDLVVVHLLVRARTVSPAAVTSEAGAVSSSASPAVPLVPRAGFVVSRAVGPAVTRNLVKRRLRHLTRERLGALPTGSMLVVRALPGAASASYVELGRELDRCLSRVTGGSTKESPEEAVISR